MDVLRTAAKIIIDKMGSRFFSLDDLVKASGRERIPVRRALERLCREGIVQKIEKRPPTKPTLEKGRPALRITYQLADKEKLANRLAPKMKEDTAQDRMWKVIRYKKTFNRRDLVILASVTHENAKWYTKVLRRAGIIQNSRLGGPGVEWTLVKDPGPQRPYVKSE